MCLSMNPRGASSIVDLDEIYQNSRVQSSPRLVAAGSDYTVLEGCSVPVKWRSAGLRDRERPLQGSLRVIHTRRRKTEGFQRRIDNPRHRGSDSMPALPVRDQRVSALRHSEPKRLAVAVGTIIADRPPLRSVRARLRSGRTMARSGLRMMPTFPSPPLKFRTAGFPRYGFKAGNFRRGLPSNALRNFPLPKKKINNQCVIIIIIIIIIIIRGGVCHRPSCSLLAS